jgi:hypothetical protein
MNTLTAPEFFNAIGTALGLPAMQPDASNTCTLTMGEKAVLTLALKSAPVAPDADTLADPLLMAFAYLGPLPANEREATLARLLEANFAWAETGGGATLALQPSTEAINLMQQWRITPELQAAGVALWIADFATVAGRWITALEQAENASGRTVNSAAVGSDLLPVSGSLTGMMGMA